MSDPKRTEVLLTRISGTALPENRSAPHPVEVGSEEWPSLRRGLVGHRLTGLALEAASQGLLVLPDESFAELHDLQRDAMGLALTLESRLVELATALRSDDIEFIVLKGPAVAHDYYPDPAWRPFSDLDLLVRDSQWERTTELLEREGFGRRLPEPRPNFDVRFGKAVAWSRAEVVIDLHRTLAAGPFGLWMEPGELWEHSEYFDLGGTPLRCLDATGQLLHACVHASLGWRPPLLLPLRDVLQIASDSSVDWSRLESWSGRWRLNAVLQHALRAATAGFRSALPPAAEPLLAAPVNARERRALEAYTTTRRHRGGTAVAALAAIPGLGARAAYARSLLWPDREFLKARSANGGRASYLRRWTTPASWLIDRRQ
jgi:hypothetical protein